MTAFIGPLTQREENRRAEALAELTARLAPLQALPDGTVVVEPAGPHFLVITKEESMLRFWLVEQADSSTGVIQSEIDLAEPLMLQEAYTQAMLLGLLWQPQPRSIYVAGFGGGRLPLLLHHYCPQTQITCSEIEPEIIRLAERFFGIRQDERLQVVVEDGRNWLARQRDPLDLILVDVFLDNGYSPYRMATVEFYALCRERLTSNGVVAVNLLANDPFLERRIQSLVAAFPAVWLLTARPFDGDENIIVVATAAPELEKATLCERAQTLDGYFSFPFGLAPLATMLTRQQATGAPPLWDDEPPPGYFDSLPSFAGPFSRVGPELPCPCGSGRRFADCHGPEG
jgi:spermidine synthase